MINALKIGMSGALVASLVTLTACSGSSGSNTPETTEEEPLNKILFVGDDSKTGTELWSSDGTEAGTILVKDINAIGHSEPSNFAQLGNTTFFTADNGVNGTELWKTDASGTSQVVDLNPDGSSFISHLTIFKDELFFILRNNTPTASAGLWKSDGTATGTVPVNTIYSFSSTRTIKSTTAYMYFSTGSVIYRSDGTSTGTSQLPTSLTTGERYNSAYDIEATADAVYFAASSYNAAGSYIGNKLWMSDDSTSEIAMVNNALTMYSSSGKMAALNNSLVFMASDSTSSNVLWITDGTLAGTVLLKDSLDQNLPAYTSANLFSADSKVFYFRNFRDLWTTDGTPAGTLQVHTNANSSLYSAKNGNAYFSDYNDRSLWFTDGTVAGTIQLTSNSVSRTSSTATDFYFTSYENNNNLALWKSSGTVASTQKILSMQNPIGESSAITSLYATGNSLFFSGYDSKTGYELWKSDGTDAGTAIVKDINTTSNADSQPRGYAELNNKVYFVAFSDETGYAIWQSDGTPDGTSVIKSGFSDISQLVVAGNNIFFSGYTDENGSELWVSDGTTEGTQIIIELYEGEQSTDPYDFYAVNDYLYFNIEGLMLRTDGTEEGTEVVSLSDAESMQHIGDKLFFITHDNNYDYELWVTEGTLLSTRLVKDINPTDSSLDSNDPLIVMGDNIYFGANDGVNGYELWKSDGTEAGTTIVTNLYGNNSGLESFNRDEFAVANNELYFIGNDLNGIEVLYKTDGTEAGTVAITDETTSLRERRIDNMYSYNDEIYFAGDNNEFDEELWKTDGTAAGTIMLKDIEIDGDSNPYGFKEVNGILFFFAQNDENGEELWKTDGTTEGTVLVKDIYEGYRSGAYNLSPFSSNGGGDHKCGREC